MINIPYISTNTLLLAFYISPSKSGISLTFPLIHIPEFMKMMNG